MDVYLLSRGRQMLLPVFQTEACVPRAALHGDNAYDLPSLCKSVKLVLINCR